MQKDTRLDNLTSKFPGRRKPGWGEWKPARQSKRTIRHLPTMLPIRCWPLVHASGATGRCTPCGRD